MAGRRPTASALEAWHALLSFHARALARLDVELREAHGIPLDWYDVLFQLADAGGERTMGELSGALLVAPSNCTRRVDRMTEAGLVERRRDTGDSRVVHAHLTAEGRDLQRRAAVTHVRGIERHFGRFLDAPTATAMAEALRAAAASA